MPAHNHDVPAGAPGPGGLPPRRLAYLPLTGPGAVYTEPQGRQGQSFAPEALADLISSIAAIGQLEPVLAEEIQVPDGGVTYRLVAGERRLRAMLWGAANMPDNPNFAALEAIVCPGPLPESVRRRWQAAENLAREQLRPGELAAQLLWQRCALLAERLTAAGCPVPPATAGAGDPADRYRLLEEAARQAPGVAAPWADVIADLGITMSPRRARAVTAAFRALPRDVSADMDAHGVTVAARLDAARLTGHADAAAEIWAAVKGRGRPDLLASAAAALAADPAAGAAAAAGRAEVLDDAAAAARASGRARVPAGQLIDPALTSALLAALRSYTGLLRAGGYPGQFETGSVRLLALQVAGQLEDLDPAAQEAT